MGSGATSHKLTIEKNDKYTRCGNKIHHGRQWNTYQKKRGYSHGYQKRDGKLHSGTSINTSVIPGIHANLFYVMQSPNKGFQVTSEGETIIITIFLTEIQFDKKVGNTGSNRFILTTKLYMKPRKTTPLSTKN